jgi:hypothetical protein
MILIMNFSQFHTEPFGLKVGKGKVDGHKSVHKFGAVNAMSQNQSGSIWDIDDTNYPWNSFNSASTLDIPAVNSSDSGKTVTIIGLDANYNEQTESVVVSSSTTSTTTNSFIRVYRAFIEDGTTNVGDILIQVSAVTVCKITAGKGQTLMAIYTVPAGYTGYLMKGTASCQAGADATVNMFVRYFGQDSFRIGHSLEVSGTGGQYVYDFSCPVKIPEKSDIDVRGTMRSNNARLTAAFDLILQSNSSIILER